jgi:hypothetical protein
VSNLIVGAILSTALLPGCAAVLLGAGAGAGAGTVAYIQGEHSQVHSGGYERVWSASLDALKQMNITVIKSQKDDLGGTIAARRADDTAVNLKVEPTGKDTTTVKVRIGTFGDKAASEAIQERIVAALGGRR